MVRAGVRQRLSEAQVKQVDEAWTASAEHKQVGIPEASPLNCQEERSPLLMEAEKLAFKFVIQSPTTVTHWLQSLLQTSGITFIAISVTLAADAPMAKSAVKAIDLYMMMMIFLVVAIQEMSFQTLPRFLHDL